MAWAYRAGSYAADGAGFSIDGNLGTATVTLGAALTAGDLIVLGITALGGVGGSITPTFTVSDSVNGTWGSSAVGEVATVTWTVVGLNVRSSVWAFPNTGAGTPVITLTMHGTSADGYPGGMHCAAFSGIVTTSPKDVSAAATGTGANPSSGAVGATAAANELMVGVYMDQGENQTRTVGNINGVGATLAGKHDVDGGHWEGLFEYGDSGSLGGTPTATSTGSANAGWAMMGAVFKIIAGAPAAPVGELIMPRQAVNRAAAY